MINEVLVSHGTPSAGCLQIAPWSGKAIGGPASPQRASCRTWGSKKTPIHHPQQFAGEQSEQIFEQRRLEIEDLDGADASKEWAAQRSRQREGRCRRLAYELCSQSMAQAGLPCITTSSSSSSFDLSKELKRKRSRISRGHPSSPARKHPHH